MTLDQQQPWQPSPRIPPQTAQKTSSSESVQQSFRSLDSQPRTQPAPQAQRPMQNPQPKPVMNDYPEGHKHFHVLIPFIILLILIGGLVAFYFLMMGGQEEVEFERSQLSAPSSEPMSDAEVVKTIFQEAIEELNPEKCAMLEDSSERDRCFHGIAQFTNNELLCDNISVETGDISVYACYAQLAIARMDTGTCENLQLRGPLPGGYCYFKYAEAYDDPFYCDYIMIEEGEFSGDTCRAMFEV